MAGKAIGFNEKAARNIIPRLADCDILRQTGQTMSQSPPLFIDVGAGPAARRIAVRMRAGVGTPVVWFGGFRSDMMSTKALALDEWCAAHNRPMILMDYMGHGESSGRFVDGTISLWAEDAAAVLDSVVPTKPIIVGSSMGGWIAVLIAARRAALVEGENPSIAGLVLIAPACDFTEKLMWPQFSDEIRREIMDKGVWHLPSAYSDDPTPITRALIEDGRNNLVLDRPLRLGCPVHILQGLQDPDVPASHTLQLVEHLALDPVTVTLIEDGDHRLSRDQDIAKLIGAVAGMEV
jgi:pimeloyl-ACP methyl ester carboxylesterase